MNKFKEEESDSWELRNSRLPSNASVLSSLDTVELSTAKNTEEAVSPPQISSSFTTHPALHDSVGNFSNFLYTGSFK